MNQKCMRRTVILAIKEKSGHWIKLKARLSSTLAYGLIVHS